MTKVSMGEGCRMASIRNHVLGVKTYEAQRGKQKKWIMWESVR